MRRLTARFGGAVSGKAWRITDIEKLALHWQPDLNFMVSVRFAVEREQVEQFKTAGLTNVEWVEAEGLEEDDVVVPEASLQRVVVLYRRSDRHHGLQLTNRCNSYCLMCSQPPTTQDDAWMVQESLDIIRHIPVAPDVLGLSGGEPLLLGEQLRNVLDYVGYYHPTTRVEVLTNGRLLADQALSHALLDGLATSTTWLVPLYGHADFLHDFVVQAHGAYEQTLEGMLNLQSYRQAIQLRIVLIKPVLEILPELCLFIGRNLPFVREVALMACEPVGFAMANREACEVDLHEWHDTLLSAVRQLKRYSVSFVFMNTPLCTIPEQIREYAHRSISDWKNVYLPECDACMIRSECAGFFAWHDKGWKPSKKIRIIEEQLV